MKITLICVGKTDFKFVEEGVKLYAERINHYCKFEQLYIPSLKNVSSLSVEQIKDREGELIIKQIEKKDSLMILLDERGEKYTSLKWSDYLQKYFSGSKGSIREIVFVIGGAYGFSKKVYDLAHDKLSLSEMTFSHQLVRLIFVEQLYRAFTIIKGEPYHHE